MPPIQPVEDRPLAMGDYAVLTYAATFEGKPLAEIAPTAPVQLRGRNNAWVLMEEGALAPGFAAGVIGMKVNDERSISVDLRRSFR